MINPESPNVQVELLPCPFCGGSGRLFSVSFPLHADVADIQVSCSQCDIIGPSVMYEYGVHTEDDLPGLEAEATTAWNTRADNTHRQAAYNAGRIEGEREAVERAQAVMREVIGKGYPVPIEKREQCKHGQFGWEDCIACYDEALEAAIVSLCLPTPGDTA